MGNVNYDIIRRTCTDAVSKVGFNAEFYSDGNLAGVDRYGNPIAAVDPVSITGVCTPLLNFNLNQIDNAAILSGDSFLFFQPVDPTVEITVGLQIDINNKTYTATSIIRSLKDTAGNFVFQKIQVR